MACGFGGEKETKRASKHTAYLKPPFDAHLPADVVRQWLIEKVPLPIELKLDNVGKSTLKADASGRAKQPIVHFGKWRDLVSNAAIGDRINIIGRIADAGGGVRKVQMVDLKFGKEAL